MIIRNCGGSVRPKLWVSWSTGKDSAWALHVLRNQAEYEVTALLTTGTSTFDRVSMHGVRRELAEEQAGAAGVPLRWVELPYPCPNARYEAIMGEAVQQAVSEGVTHVAFGDLFLADIRAYRERMFAGSGLAPLFPLWAADTARLAKEMTESGLRAVLVCVDPKRLPERFAGRTFDEQLLAELPGNVDPCGENGEFHTFCYAGPMFERPIPVRSGVSMERDGFVFSDLILDTAGSACG
jgi:uncharacterized protein (TIGR00290 family)